MGGGDNELVINTLLDATGFTKGSQRLARAMNSLGNTVKSIGNQAQKYANVAQRSLNNVAGMAKRVVPLLIGVGSAYGVISKAVSAFMSENQELSSKMNSIWTALGNILGPIITQVINWITTAVSYFIEFLRLLGITSKTASQASKSAKGAGAELQKTVAGFDELNKLSKGGGGGGGGATLDDVDPADWMKKLADLLKNKMWDEAADIIVDKMNSLIATLKSKAEEFGEKVGEYLGGALHILARIINDVNWSDLGAAIANFFNGIMKHVDGKDLGTVLVGQIVIAIKMVTGFLQSFNWGELATILSDALIGALNSISSAIEQADWEKIGNGIRDFFLKIWEKKDEIGAAIFRILKAAWDAAWNLFLGMLGKGTEDELPIVKQFEDLKTAIEDMVKEVVPDLEKLVGQIADFIKTCEPLLTNILGIIKDVIDGIRVAFATLRAYNEGKSISDIILGNYDGGKASSTLIMELEEVGMTVEDLTGKANDANQALTTNAEITEGLAESQSRLSASSQEMSSAIEASTTTTAASAAAMEGAAGTYEGATERMTANAGNLKAAVEENMAAVDSSTVEQITHATDTATSATGDMSDQVSSDFDTMSGEVEGKMNNVNSIISNGFAEAIAGAGTWGTDLIHNFTDGMAAAFPYLESGMVTVANIVRSYLGFSEPDKGPLSNFHTYGPDMMQLYAQGIEQNTDKVMAVVSDLAGGISDAIQNGDYNMGISADSFMPSMPPDLAFSMPAVAGGSVLPYGVGGGFWSTGDQGNAEMIAAIQELQTMVTNLENALLNMQWVAQFGDLKAWVRQITRIQKENERANG